MDSRSLRRMRVASWVRWILVFALNGLLGSSGWLASMWFLLDIGSFEDQLMLSIVLMPLPLLLIVLDFRVARERGDFWRWIVVRSVAVTLAGLAVGTLVRLRFFPGDELDFRLVSAERYAWWTLAAGLALLALQPLFGILRRIAVLVFGAPRDADPLPVGAPGEAVATEAGRVQESERIVAVDEVPDPDHRAFPGRPPRWPGPPAARWIAGIAAFALVAACGSVFFGRAWWHIHSSTGTTGAPAVATGTVDGRELVAVPYTSSGFLGIVRDSRVAAFDAATGELVWDQRLELREDPTSEVEAVVLDERGAFVHSRERGGLDPEEFWTVLDAETGAPIAERVPVGGVPSSEVPEDVVEYAEWLDDHISDEGIDYEFGDDADIIPVPRYGESRLVYPLTGRPAGETGGFRLDRFCCQDGPLLELRVDDELVARYPSAPYSRSVVAETESGRVVIYGDAGEGKGALVIVDATGFRTSVIGDRGWIPWLG